MTFRSTVTEFLYDNLKQERKQWMWSARLCLLQILLTLVVSVKQGKTGCNNTWENLFCHMQILSVNFMGHQHEKTGDQNFPKDFLLKKIWLFFMGWANQVRALPWNLAAQLNCTFESHQFPCPCLKAEEEILLQKKPLQSPLLLVSGALHILRDSLSSLSEIRPTAHQNFGTAESGAWSGDTRTVMRWFLT